MDPMKKKYWKKKSALCSILLDAGTRVVGMTKRYMEDIRSQERVNSTCNKIVCNSSSTHRKKCNTHLQNYQSRRCGVLLMSATTLSRCSSQDFIPPFILTDVTCFLDFIKGSLDGTTQQINNQGTNLVSSLQAFVSQ